MRKNNNRVEKQSKDDVAGDVGLQVKRRRKPADGERVFAVMSHCLFTNSLLFILLRLCFDVDCLDAMSLSLSFAMRKMIQAGFAMRV